MRENYLAGGWFTKTQASKYDKVCSLIKDNNLQNSFFIPKYSGINLMEYDEPTRLRKTVDVFAIDTGMMMYSIAQQGFTLAIIDDMDPGMLWELGAFWGLTHGTYPIVTFTAEDYGLNVMVRMSVKGHIKGYESLNKFLGNFSLGFPVLEIVEDEEYQNFNPKIF